MAALKDQRIGCRCEEGLRSQVGETQHRITSYCHNSQLFGFTGTPIFADNANKHELGKRTTKDMFEDSGDRA